LVIGNQPTTNKQQSTLESNLQIGYYNKEPPKHKNKKSGVKIGW
jgi:hypothetical protein